MKEPCGIFRIAFLKLISCINYYKVPSCFEISVIKFFKKLIL